MLNVGGVTSFPDCTYCEDGTTISTDTLTLNTNYLCVASATPGQVQCLYEATPTLTPSAGYY